ncbi:MAG: ABC transporter ATP-binding protein [Patescibacteria group bacterium]
MKSHKSTSTNVKTIKLFWHFTSAHPWLFWYATITAVIATLANNIIPPLVIAKAFNRLQHLYATNQAITFDVMKPYLIGYSASIIAAFFLWRTQAYSAWRYFILTEQTIMEKVFDHIQYMDDKFHSDRFGGALVSQTNKLVTAYDRVANIFNWSIMTGITAFVSSLIVLAFVNTFYAAVFFVTSVLYCVVIYKQMMRQVPYNRTLSSSESDTTAKLADTITNVATVRAFAGEPIESKLFNRQTTHTRKSFIKLVNVQTVNEAIGHGGTALIEILAFGIGLWSITMFATPIGALYLAITYTMALSERLWQFMFVLRDVSRALGDAGDMTEILELEPAVKDKPTLEPSRISAGAINLVDVSFHYDEKQNALFENLNLNIQAGEQVGLVGHSGGGKSSLVRLLSRFMDVASGQILIDGQNIANISQQALRKHIGYVPQDPLLFHRSLMENIRYGRPEATDEEVVKVASLAHADEFIRTLPQGYETLVGERGVKLSGGQRQRVAIARAMLKNAPILILDEATSALDSESEVLIQDALWKLMEGRTAIVIAHRLSTIQKMDRIIVMEDGAIVEQGSHKQLLQQEGTYSKLWTHQSGGFLED